MKINVLGTEYTIIVKNYDEDEVFPRRSIDGYCDSWTNQIVVCDMATYKGWEHETPNTIEAEEKCGFGKTRESGVYTTFDRPEVAKLRDRRGRNPRHQSEAAERTL